MIPSEIENGHETGEAVGDNMRMVKRFGEDINDLVNDLDLQSNITAHIKGILEKNLLNKQGKIPSQVAGMSRVEKMSLKITKLDFTSQPLLSGDMQFE